ncbi:MAG: hypothetical protein AABZ08_00025 [Planctomycetota bacterium]
MAETSSTTNGPSSALSSLPPDELRRYASELGLGLHDDAAQSLVLAAVRARQELLLELDREAMLDVVIWGRQPVRKSASKETLAKTIAAIQQANYDSLSTRGLYVLARLRGLAATAQTSANDLIDRLRTNDGFWTTVRRKRRAIVGSLLTKIIDGKRPPSDTDYQFLPEEDGAQPERRTLKDAVVERGLVGGIAQKLRGAADDYIKIKLDEIEARIDDKLEQIDRRLGEWRDREVANRLRILRLTLIFTVLVALLSLGYNYVKSRVGDNQSASPTTKQQP